MKSLKKTLALVLSLVMLVSTMSFTAFAAEKSPASTGATETDATKVTVTVPSVNYTGKAQTATGIVVKYGDVTLVEGTDYVITTNNGGTNTGDYKVVIEGKGKYKFAKEATFTIKAAKKAQLKVDKKAAVKVKKTTVKASKKKAVKTSITVKKAKKNKAVPTYTLKKAPKGGKKFVKIGKNGKITFKKGAKKGTYKFKVTIPAYNNFKKVSKVVTITVA